MVLLLYGLVSAAFMAGVKEADKLKKFNVQPVETYLPGTNGWA
jgi:hypothetical protein